MFVAELGGVQPDLAHGVVVPEQQVVPAQREIAPALDFARVAEIIGQLANGEITSVRISPADTAVANYAFDVTPARLVTGLITERGICAANADGVLKLYPEKK